MTPIEGFVFVDTRCVGETVRTDPNGTIARISAEKAPFSNAGPEELTKGKGIMRTIGELRAVTAKVQVSKEPEMVLFRYAR